MRGINIVLIIALLGAIMVIPATAYSTTIYVNTTGWWIDPAQFNASSLPIQPALDYASDGDTVFIYNGTYEYFYYSIAINTPNITLRGEGADVVTWDGGGDEWITIGDVGDASGFIIEGLTIKNSTYGIAYGSAGGSNYIIRDCVFEWLTSEIQIGGSNATFMNNIVTGSSDLSCLRVIGSSCTIDNNTLINNPFSTTSKSAIFIKGTNCTVSNNTILNNTGRGIGLSSTSSNGIITQNNISSNYLGFKVFTAEGHEIYLNNVRNNTAGSVQYGTTPPTTIYWNSTEQIEYVYGGTTYTNYLGNYWSDYDFTGKDPDGDGIGNLPYVVHGTDMDHRPLMVGFKNYPAPAAGICGDVNKDGSVNVLDATKVKNRAGNPSYPLDDEWAADANCDTFINVLDATKVKNRAGNPGYPLNCCP